MNTPSGKATSSRCRLFRVTPASRSQPFGRARRPAGAAWLAEEVAAGLRLLDVAGAPRAGRCRARGRPARPRPGPTSTIQSAWRITSRSCSTTNSELPGGLQPVERPQQRLGVGRVQPRGRLVEHVDHAEQVGADLGGQPQPLELARREGGRAPLQREVAEPEVEQDGEPRRRGPGRSAGRPAPSPGAPPPASPGRRPSRPRTGAGCRRAGPAARGRSRRCRGPRTSPTATRGGAACPGRAGTRCSACTASARFFISGLCVLAKVCSTCRRALVNVPCSSAPPSA